MKETSTLWKRITSALLTAAMVVTSVTVPVYADDTPPPEETAPDNPIGTHIGLLYANADSAEPAAEPVEEPETVAEPEPEPEPAPADEPEAPAADAINCRHEDVEYEVKEGDCLYHWVTCQDCGKSWLAEHVNSGNYEDTEGSCYCGMKFMTIPMLNKKTFHKYEISKYDVVNHKYTCTRCRDSFLAEHWGGSTADAECTACGMTYSFYVDNAWHFCKDSRNTALSQKNAMSQITGNCEYHREVCSECGKSFETPHYDAYLTGKCLCGVNLTLYSQHYGMNTHVWERKEIDENFCQDVCSLCSKTRNRSIHEFDDNGVCINCGYVKKECEHKERKAIDAGNGKHGYRCLKCGIFIRDEDGKLVEDPHTWETDESGNIKWYKENGVTYKECELCGAKDSTHDHDYAKYIDLYDGTHAKRCIICDEYERDESGKIIVYPHLWFLMEDGSLIWWTESGSPYPFLMCMICQAKEYCYHNADKEYEDNGDGKTHSIVCGECGKVLNSEFHTFDYRSKNYSVHFVSCKYCNMPKVEEDHEPEYTYDEKTHTARCKICTMVLTDKEPHEWSEWVANGNIAERTCNVCGKTEQCDHAGKGRKYKVAGAASHYEYCTYCGSDVNGGKKIYCCQADPYRESLDEQNHRWSCRCGNSAVEYHVKNTYKSQNTIVVACKYCNYRNIRKLDDDPEVVNALPVIKSAEWLENGSFALKVLLDKRYWSRGNIALTQMCWDADDDLQLGESDVLTPADTDKVTIIDSDSVWEVDLTTTVNWIGTPPDEVTVRVAAGTAGGEALLSKMCKVRKNAKTEPEPTDPETCGHVDIAYIAENEESHYKVCEKCSTVLESGLAHEWEEELIPSAANENIMSRKCRLCGYKVLVIIPVTEWNLFDNADEQVFEVSITSKTEVQNSNKSSAKFFDATLSKNMITVRLKDGADRKKAATNNLLEFNLGAEGTVSYFMPLVYIKPTFKLSSTKATVKAGVSTAVKTTVLVLDDNGSYVPYDLTGARLQYGSNSIKGDANGVLTITVSGKANDKIVITRDGWNEYDPVQLAFSVSTVTKDVLAVDLGGLKQVVLNTNAPEQMLSFPLTFNGEPVNAVKPNGARADAAVVEPSATEVTIVPGKKGEEQLASIGNGVLTLSLGRSGLKKGSYTINLKAGDAKLAVKVKVSDKALRSAVTVKIKQKYDIVTKQPMVVTPTLKEVTGDITAVKLIGPEGFDPAVDGENIVIDYTGKTPLTSTTIGDMTLQLTVSGITTPIEVQMKNVTAQETTPTVKAAKVVIPKSATMDGTTVIATANIMSTYKDSAKNVHNIAPDSVTLSCKNVEATVDSADNCVINITKLTGKSGSIKATLTYAGGVTKTVTINVSLGK